MPLLRNTLSTDLIHHPFPIIQIARLFLGQTVKIEMEKEKEGQMVLQDIRRTA